MLKLTRRQKRAVKKYIESAMLGFADTIFIIVGCFSLAVMLTLAFLVLTNL